MLWSWYIFQNVAHSIFVLMACFIFPHMLLLMNCKSKCTLFDHPDSQKKNISPTSGVDKVIFWWLLMYISTIQSKSLLVIFLLTYGRSRPGDYFKAILWFHLRSSKDSSHLSVWTWFIAQKMIFLCLLDTKTCCMGITIPELHVAIVRYLKIWDAWLMATKFHMGKSRKLQ